MDILSHGLWGGIAFGRKSRGSFWLAFAIGLAPDLLSFGILWTAVILGLADSPDFSHGTPPESTIPPYVHHLYDVTHSFLVFLFVFLLIWFATKRPRWEIARMGSARAGRRADPFTRLLRNPGSLALGGLEV